MLTKKTVFNFLTFVGPFLNFYNCWKAKKKLLSNFFSSRPRHAHTVIKEEYLAHPYKKGRLGKKIVHRLNIRKTKMKKRKKSYTKMEFIEYVAITMRQQPTTGNWIVYAIFRHCACVWMRFRLPVRLVKRQKASLGFQPIFLQQSCLIRQS